MYYYAKLNENQICTEIISRARELPKDLGGYVKIADYNETLLWRKYDEKTGWSQERYEPSIEAELQEKVRQQDEEILNLTNSNNVLNNKVIELEGTIMELTTIIAGLQGGAK